MHYGATPADWAHFSLILGLTEDLLPVVSNPNAKISELSKMAAVGKTPSRYNGQHQTVGFPDWTSHKSGEHLIQSWKQQPDYGICLQTRVVRALDIDVDDQELADEITAKIVEHLGPIPTRMRGNSAKRLLAFELPGEFYKRKFKTRAGIVEFLATGQQFIAIGTHTSGVRYEWEGGLPYVMPAIDAVAFEALWQDLVQEFAVEAPSESAASSKQGKLLDLHATDPVSLRLAERGMVLSTTREGRLDITCPFEQEHTGPSSESSTSYYPPNTGGYALGHFKCLHAHCEHRSDQEFEEAIGLTAADDFDDISNQPAASSELIQETGNPLRFQTIQAAEFVKTKPPTWIIKGLIPQAEVGVMFGDSGSGKSFMALNLAGAIARGEPWRGLKTKQGRVVYIAAEGAGGCKNRMKAYAEAENIALEDLDIHFIPSAPSFLDKRDVIDVLAALDALGDVDLIVVDTWAQVTAGGNENSGEDMGTALKHCRLLHKQTGAMTLLIHHSGKNSAAGARGWSGLRAAADVELEVLRSDDDRVMTVTKQKDGQDGQEFGFQLQSVRIGEDDDGDELTSCKVVESSMTKAAVDAKPAPKEGDLMAVIGEMHQELGIWPWSADLKERAKQTIPDISRTFTRMLDRMVAKGQILRDAEDRISIPDPTGPDALTNLVE